MLSGGNHKKREGEQVKTLPDIGGIGSKVIDARLSVCKRNTFEINKEDLRINAYQVTSSWNADSLTYNNQPESDGYILDYMLFAADNKVQPDYHDNYGYLEFKTIEITNIVRQWYEDTDKNYGILLDTENENMNKTWFHSIQNTTYEKSRPVLTVSYRNQSGYEDYWSYTNVTFDVPAGCRVRLILGFSASGNGTVWYDDLQLEKGEGESAFNLVENSSFTNGTAQWSSNTTKTSSDGLSGLPNCGYTNGDPTDRWKGISQQMTVAGKANDVYSFGAWVKAASVPIDNDTKEEQANKPAFNLALHYYDANGLWKGCQNIPINADLKNQWQFISGEYIIPNDYYKICVELIYFNNVNTVSITGAFCYKEQYGQTYDYDKNGNIVSAVDIAKTNSAFSYYGNQMSRMLNPSGSAYMYTYNDKKQLTYALSTDGQQYGFSYDDKGNVTKAEITARKPATTIESGKEYYVINSYSGLALDSYWAGNSGDTASTFRFTPGSSEQIWKLELVSGTTDVFRLKTMVAPSKNLYLDVRNGLTAHGTMMQIANSNSSSAQKFKIVKERDNTFSLFTGNTNYEKLVDGQYHGNEIIQSEEVYQTNPYPNKEEPCYGQRWYFYPVENSVDKTIATETAYTDSKNFVKSSKDQRGNETSYTYNEQKGTLTSTTDALGRTTNYTYDPNNNSLLSVSSGGMTNSYAYENDRLKTITVNGGLQYAFQYDAFGRTTETKVGNGTNWRTLSSLEYNSKGLLGKQTYGNGDYIDFTYDNLDRVTEKKYNGDANNRAVYRYGNDGSLAQTIDFSTGTRTKFTYDLADRLVSQKEYNSTSNNGGALISSTDFTYADKTNYLTGVKHFSPLGTQNIGYTYGDINQGEMPDRVYKVFWNGNAKIMQDYDSLGRLGMRVYLLEHGMLINRYRYVNVGEDKTTTLLEAMRTEVGTYSYTYDAVGNITSVSLGEEYTNSYVYDTLNQLVRENNGQTGKTYTYSYVNGNITERKEYAYTTGALGEILDTKTWSYTDNTWSDLLTNFNGKTISYDEIGNPTTIGNQSLSWNGRQLQEITDSDNTYTYLYNTDGQRVFKTVNGVTTEYFYNGNVLAGQKTGNDTIVFMYDNSGNYFGFTYNDTEYYYVKNAQNDVVAIVESSNKSVIAKYQYDAWGNVVSVTDADGNEITDSTHIANVNPLRYRSYYFDRETGFYYLNSRYYSPEICRFLNADGYASTNQGLLGSKMFAYCLNNPVNFHDPSGNYAVIIPAEGDEDMIIIPDEGDPNLTASHQGNTYTVEVQRGTGGGSAAGVISAINGEVLQEVVKQSILQLENIEYKNYVRITFSNASGAVLKNIGRTFNNTIYTALRPCLDDMKIVGDCVVTAAAFLVDICTDYDTYGGYTASFNKAVIIDTVYAGLGLVGAALLLNPPTSVPTAVVIGFGIIFGVSITYAKDAAKEYFIE